jgi:ubiquinone biosynthesis protein UbiJ
MRSFFEKKLQTILNSYLALDPESKQRLKQLADHVVTLELKGINLTFQLVFTNNKVVIKSDNFMQADTIIKGTPLSLLRMTLTSGDRKKFFADDISIEGNLDLGQQVIDLFDNLDIDWEEYLSRLTGDVPAHQINRVLRNIKKFTTRLRDTMTQNINEYTHEEINLFPPREALQDFFYDVDALRMDTDRLEARMTLLTKKLAVKRGIE